MNYDQKIAARLMKDLMNDFGLNRAQAAGVVGNLAHESGGFKTLQEKGYQRYGKNARGGYGYAQWTGPRRRQYEAWSREKGLNPSTYDANYGFLKHEFLTTEKGALKRIKASTSPAQAAIATEKYYERPGTPHRKSRLAFTNHIFGLSETAPPPPFPTGNNIPIPTTRERRTFPAPMGQVERGQLLLVPFTPVRTSRVERGLLPPVQRSTPTPRSSGLLSGPAQQYAPKASDYANYGMSARSSPPVPKQTAFPSGENAPIPSLMGGQFAGPQQGPQPSGIMDAIHADPVDAFPPAPTIKQSIPQKISSGLKKHVKKQFNPKTLAARAIGGLLAGPSGAAIAPTAFGLLGDLTGIKGPQFNGFDNINLTTPPIQRSYVGYNGGAGPDTARYGARGTTYNHSNGGNTMALGNGRYQRTNKFGVVERVDEDGTRSVISNPNRKRW